MWAAAAKHPSSAIQVMMPPPLAGELHPHMLEQMLLEQLAKRLAQSAHASEFPCLHHTRHVHRLIYERPCPSNEYNC